jgi:hypothetical protein
VENPYYSGGVVEVDLDGVLTLGSEAIRVFGTSKSGLEHTTQQCIDGSRIKRMKTNMFYLALGRVNKDTKV